MSWSRPGISLIWDDCTHPSHPAWEAIEERCHLDQTDHENHTLCFEKKSLISMKKMYTYTFLRVYIFDPYTQNLVFGLRVTFVIWLKLRVNNLVWSIWQPLGSKFLPPLDLGGPMGFHDHASRSHHSSCIFSKTAIVARVASTPVHGGHSGSWTRHHLL